MGYIFGVVDYLFYYLVAQYVGMGVLGVYFVYSRFLKIAYLAEFYRTGENLGKPYARKSKKRFGRKDERSTAVSSAVKVKVTEFKASMIPEVSSKVVDKKDYVWVGECEFKLKDKFIQFMNKSFSVALGIACRRKRGFTIYAFDYDTGDCITFGGVYQNVEPDFANRHLFSGVVERILEGAKKFSKELMIIFVVVVIVVAVTAGLAGYFYGNDAGFQSGADFMRDLLNRTADSGYSGGFMP